MTSTFSREEYTFEIIAWHRVISIIEKVYSSRLKAFTLAEVLIVLGIIGLIADMTIPTLIQNTQEKVAVSQLKKVYSTLENSYRMAAMDNGTPDEWGLQEDGAQKILDNFKPHLNIIRDCSTNADCFSDNVKSLHGAALGFQQTSIDMAKVLLADGTAIGFYMFDANCTMAMGTSPAEKQTCAVIHIDLNGLKKPNQMGVDMFRFMLTKRGVIPSGLETNTESTFPNICNKSSTTVYNGYGCTAWVLYNENMDYLRCDDLSWSGKKSCNQN